MAIRDSPSTALTRVSENASSFIREYRQTRLGKLVLLFPALFIIGVFMIFPSIILVLESISPIQGLAGLSSTTLEHYARALTTPLYQNITLRTVRIAVIVTALTFLLGFPLAYAAVRKGGVVGKVIVLASLAPLTIDLVIRSFGWFVLLSGNGLVNTTLVFLGLVPASNPPKILFTEGAIIIGLTHVLLPFMVFPIINVMHTIPESLEEAATNLGANRLVVFWRVILPMALPGISAGVLITFVVTMASYVTPAMLGGSTKVVPIVITDTFTSTNNWPFASSLSVILLAIGLFAIVGYQRILSRIEEVGGI